jgi:long-chain acyl-CoA synthetase
MLFEPLFTHAGRQPQQTAIIDDQGRYTYQQLAGMAAGLGTYLASQTRQPRVGLLLPPGAGFVGTFYGALLAGKAAVPINYLLSGSEVAHIIRDSGIDTVVTAPIFAPRLAGLPLKVIDLSTLPLNASPPAIRFPIPSGDDTAVLLYTSGTSGLPKGVVLTYGNLQSVVDAAIQHVGLQNQHTFLGLIPLFHSLGITGTMLAPVQMGATAVYVARFKPAAVLSAIRENPDTIVLGVPSMFAALLRLKEGRPEDFAHVYALISGGEPLPAAVREGFAQRFGVPVYEGYGLTETGAVVALNTPASNRTGSVGKPLPGVEVRIVNDAGDAIADGQVGEIWLKGPMVMKGYHALPEETAAAMSADGYFRTGDLGTVDADGFLYITGRAKDLIIVSGEKVAPRQVEEVLLRHPAVAEATVVGKRDPVRGEVVVAFVIPREDSTPSSAELRDFGRAQGLTGWQLPREIFIVLDFPRSPTGKVLRRELAAKVNAPG